MSTSENSLTYNFIGRLDPTPVRTGRFLWHINYGFDHNDLSIAAYGLICPDNYAVFAHDKVPNFWCLYPYFIDGFEMSLREKDYSKQFSIYSYWRIDTHLLDLDWYIDPNMKSDASAYMVNSKNYVCTLNNVPSYALKLFKLNPERYNSRRPFIYKQDGVVTVHPCKNDFDTLVPDVKINDYIQWRNNQKSLCNKSVNKF